MNKHLEEVKRTLEIVDDDLDNQLNDFLNRSEKQLKVRLGFIDKVPDELDYIIVELAISRFNRKGDEGYTSYSQEGQSINYGKLLDDYENDIKAWLKKQDEDSGRVNRSAAMFV